MAKSTLRSDDQDGRRPRPASFPPARLVGANDNRPPVSYRLKQVLFLASLAGMLGWMITG